ncbi:heavy-metal-associated domain-containing protein [Fictibacillus sp. FJAT-27399]|uniref:heavy-metal-associated domain-containing protein n=1 Tax=Fictibacillus sp. FJAT-27399 TaxID=1729689 RepID=UPI0007817231|nr:heavy-metal-associated domain-containing protein [Fictibacillus sp. FJAT-27399]
METKIIKIKDIVNEQDADKIAHVLQHVWGIGQLDVNIKRGEATISFDKNMASYEDFVQAIHESGYAVEDGGLQ